MIERHGDDVSVTHYVIQNGDALRDPEMVFSISAWAKLEARFAGWVPKSFEPGGFGRVYHTVCYRNGQVAGWYPSRMKEAYAFARMWAKNLRAQCFVKRYAPGMASSTTHASMLAEIEKASEVSIPIHHAISPCALGEIHHYTFPPDLPRRLRSLAYRQAEARLKADWPDWTAYGFATASEGVELIDHPLPPRSCSC